MEIIKPVFHIQLVKYIPLLIRNLLKMLFRYIEEFQ